MATNTSPGISPFDLNPPRRPGTNDFNGAAKIDDANYPPDPQTMPNALEYNELCDLGIAYGKVVPNATISITSGTTPTIASYTAASNIVVVGTFTVTRNAAGDVSITWPASSTFATALTAPKAFLNGGPGMIWATNISNGVRVRTYNASGTLTDLDFTVDVL